MKRFLILLTLAFGLVARVAHAQSENYECGMDSVLMAPSAQQSAFLDIGDGYGICHFTYTILNTTDKIPDGGRAAIRAAFDVWSKAIGVTFEEVSSQGIFSISFGYIDGPAKILGHVINTFHIEMDSSETWRDERDTGDLFLDIRPIFIHEIGHALSCPHLDWLNSDNDAIMKSGYRPWFRDFVSARDIEALSYLYPVGQGISGPRKIYANRTAAYNFPFSSKLSSPTNWQHGPGLESVDAFHAVGRNALVVRAPVKGNYQLCAGKAENHDCADCIDIKVVDDPGLERDTCGPELIRNGHFSQSGSTFDTDFPYSPKHDNESLLCHRILAQIDTSSYYQYVYTPVRGKDKTGDGGNFLVLKAPVMLYQADRNIPIKVDFVAWSQVVNLKKDHKYAFRFSLCNLLRSYPQRHHNYQYYVSINDTEIYRSRYNRDTSWAEQNIVFDSDWAGKVQLKITLIHQYNIKEPGYLGLDDLSLKEICDPLCCKPCPSLPPIAKSEVKTSFANLVNTAGPWFPPKYMPPRIIQRKNFSTTYRKLRSDCLCFKAQFRDNCVFDCPDECVPTRFTLVLTVNGVQFSYPIILDKPPVGRPDVFEICTKICQIPYLFPEEDIPLPCSMELLVSEVRGCPYKLTLKSMTLSTDAGSPLCPYMSDEDPDLPPQDNNLQVQKPDGQVLESIEVYPNPAQKGTGFELVLEGAVEGEAILCIRDLTGRILFEEQYGYIQGQNRFVIDPDLRQAGVYLLELRTGQELHYRKIYISE